MSTQNIQTPSIKFAGTWWSTCLTIAIILIRAFQNNAEPMSQWSAMSWVWMTSPIWGSALLGLFFVLLFLVMWIWANARTHF